MVHSDDKRITWYKILLIFIYHQIIFYFYIAKKRFRNDMKLKFGQKMFEFNISAEPF